MSAPTLARHAGAASDTGLHDADLHDAGLHDADLHDADRQDTGLHDADRHSAHRHGPDRYGADDSDERARRREDALALLDGVRLARSRGSGRAGRALRQSAVHLRTVRSA